MLDMILPTDSEFWRVMAGGMTLMAVIGAYKGGQWRRRLKALCQTGEIDEADCACSCGRSEETRCLSL